MSKPLPFDRPTQSKKRQVLIEYLRGLIPCFQTSLGLRTALDVGCGVGHYSSFLQDLGLRVVGTDARALNIAGARKRYPGIEFHVADVEDPELTSLGTFDLVLCLGLLYHLENPVRAMRRIHALTGKLLLIESRAVPAEEPFFVIMDEPSGEDMSLEAVSCCPSEGAIIKMAYRAGFPNVYRVRELPDDENYRRSAGRKQSRTMIAASIPPLDPSLVEVVLEPTGDWG